MVEGMRVDVYVGRTIRQFIVKLTGSDEVAITKQSYLSKRISLYLSQVAQNYRVPKDRSDYITIILPWRSGSNRVHTLYRWYLDEEAQGFVRSYYYDLFKGKLHEHVLARADVTSQREAIYDFAKKWDIDLTTTDFETLKKSWDRSIEKRKLFMGFRVPTKVK